MVNRNAKKLLFAVADACEEVGLDYFLYGGTCLGAVREKRFIKIDRDVDFACLLEDLAPVVLELNKILMKAGLDTEIVDHRHFAKWDGSVYAMKFAGFGEHGEIAAFKRHGDKRVIPSHADKYWLVHNARFLEELRTIKFYGRAFHVPKDTDGFLTEKYGDWRTPHTKFYNVSKCRMDKLP